MDQSIQVLLNALPNLLLGATVTLQLTAITVLLGMIFGSLIDILRLSSSPILQFLARCYVDFLPGTPLLVQIFIIYL